MGGVVAKSLFPAHFARKGGIMGGRLTASNAALALIRCRAAGKSPWGI